MFTTPVIVYPVTEADSVGDRENLAPYEVLGYVYDEVVIVENERGEKEVSKRQVYLSLDDISAIKSTYKITTLDSINQKIIRRQEYRGRRSQTLIGVLYLP
jgi:hypothetical protein